MAFNATYYCEKCLREVDTTDPRNPREEGGINICQPNANGQSTHIWKQKAQQGDESNNTRTKPVLSGSSNVRQRVKLPFERLKNPKTAKLDASAAKENEKIADAFWKELYQMFGLSYNDSKWDQVKTYDVSDISNDTFTTPYINRTPPTSPEPKDEKSNSNSNSNDKEEKKENKEEREKFEEYVDEVVRFKEASDEKQQSSVRIPHYAITGCTGSGKTREIHKILSNRHIARYIQDKSVSLGNGNVSPVSFGVTYGKTEQNTKRIENEYPTQVFCWRILLRMVCDRSEIPNVSKFLQDLTDLCENWKKMTISSCITLVYGHKAIDSRAALIIGIDESEMINIGAGSSVPPLTSKAVCAALTPTKNRRSTSHDRRPSEESNDSGDNDNSGTSSYVTHGVIVRTADLDSKHLLEALVPAKGEKSNDKASESKKPELHGIYQILSDIGLFQDFDSLFFPFICFAVASLAEHPILAMSESSGRLTVKANTNSFFTYKSMLECVESSDWYEKLVKGPNGGDKCEAKASIEYLVELSFGHPKYFRSMYSHFERHEDLAGCDIEYEVDQIMHEWSSIFSQTREPDNRPFASNGTTPVFKTVIELLGINGISLATCCMLDNSQEWLSIDRLQLKEIFKIKDGRIVFPYSVLEKLLQCEVTNGANSSSNSNGAVSALEEQSQSRKGNYFLLTCFRAVFKAPSLIRAAGGKDFEHRLASFQAIKSYYYPQSTATFDTIKSVGSKRGYRQMSSTHWGYKCALKEYLIGDRDIDGSIDVSKSVYPLLDDQFLFPNITEISKFDFEGNPRGEVTKIDEGTLRPGVIYMPYSNKFAGIDWFMLVQHRKKREWYLMTSQAKQMEQNKSDKDYSDGQLSKFSMAMHKALQQCPKYAKLRIDVFFSHRTGPSDDAQMDDDVTDSILIQKDALLDFLGPQFYPFYIWQSTANKYGDSRTIQRQNTE